MFVLRVFILGLLYKGTGVEGSNLPTVSQRSDGFNIATSYSYWWIEIVWLGNTQYRELYIKTRI